MNQRIFQTVIQQGFKRFYSSSTEGTIHQILTKETNEGGWKILEKINVKKNWTQMSRTKKTILCTYFGVASSEFIISVYGNGKTHLLKYRSTASYSQKTPSQIESEEWLAVKKGCNENLTANFWKSIFFPFTAVADFMPQVVLFINSKNRSN